MLYNSRKFLSIEQLMTVFNTLIFPVYNYGIELYGNATNYMASQLQNVQNKILKIIHMKPIWTPTLNIHHYSKTLLIKDNHTLRLLLTIHKIVHDSNTLPEELRNCFELNSRIHSYPTRTQSNIFLSATSFARINKIIEVGSIAWNKSPMTTRNIKNRDQFKNKIIAEFLNSYK